MANAYKVKQDITIPRAVSSEEHDGQTTYDTESVNYGVGDYVLEESISPPVLERVQGGELDDFLESADRDEAENALRAGETYGTFVAEHSAEAFILDQYGHTVVPREQAVELSAAGAEAATEHMDKVKSDESDARALPGLPEDEVSEDQVPAERPPGIPIGDTLARAKGGGSGTARRARPGREAKETETTGAEQAPVQPSQQQSGAESAGPSTGRARPRGGQDKS